MEDEILQKNCRKNVKRYQYYKMFAYDFLFYYAISVMYFTITKGFSVSQVMYLSAFYTLFVFIWQFPANMIAEKLGTKQSMVLGNSLICITILSYLFISDFKWMLIGEALGALGFTLKSLTEGTLLYVSLKKINRKEDFSKIEGKANSKYYYYEAISSILSGFLFIWNNYIPMIICLVNIVISLVISIFFKDIRSDKVGSQEETLKIKDVIKQFKKIIQTKRARAIFLFSFFFMGIISVTGTIYKAILIDFSMQTQYITMLVCLFTVFVGIGAKVIYYLEKKTKNKTLTMLSIPFVCAFIIMGILGLTGKLTVITLSIFMILLVIMGFIQGAYRVAIKKYVLNFTTTSTRTKITSIYYMSENLGSTIMLFITGTLLDVMSNAMMCVIYGSIMFIVIIAILKYMKTRIGVTVE